MPNGPWHYGLCHCCGDCGACLEAWWCVPCQVSRQCNMFHNKKPDIHWPLCVGICCTECCGCYSLISCLLICQMRSTARERYGIGGGCCGDCCAAWCCRPCTVEQILLEMTVMNDFPGATCYSVTPQPSATLMK